MGNKCPLLGENFGGLKSVMMVIRDLCSILDLIMLCMPISFSL